MDFASAMRRALEQTRSGDQAETFKSEGKVLAQNLRVAMPGIIQSFDADAVTAVVQPAIRCVETDRYEVAERGIPFRSLCPHDYGGPESGLFLYGVGKAVNSSLGRNDGNIDFLLSSEFRLQSQSGS